jgi:hypothetical protein
MRHKQVSQTTKALELSAYLERQPGHAAGQAEGRAAARVRELQAADSTLSGGLMQALCR